MAFVGLFTCCCLLCNVATEHAAVSLQCREPFAAWRSALMRSPMSRRCRWGWAPLGTSLVLGFRGMSCSRLAGSLQLCGGAHSSRSAGRTAQVAPAGHNCR